MMLPTLNLYDLKFGMTYYSHQLEGRFRLEKEQGKTLEKFSVMFQLWLRFDEKIPSELPLFYPEA